MGTVQVQAPVPPQGPRLVSRQPNPAQQEVPPAEQVWPELTHIAAWQVPNSAPAAMAQLVPVQQSPEEVHTAPRPWQTTATPQVPLVQTSFVVQALPSLTLTGVYTAPALGLQLSTVQALLSLTRALSV